MFDITFTACGLNGNRTFYDFELVTYHIISFEYLLIEIYESKDLIETYCNLYYLEDVGIDELPSLR